MLEIGAGQLSSYLCQIGLGLDYKVTVCEPCEEYLDTWNVPGATLIPTMPDDTVLDMNLDERRAVIALMHDPKLDDLALMEAPMSPALYIGALGFAQEQHGAARAAGRLLRPEQGRTQQVAQTRRDLYRQPDATGDCRVHTC
jgi:xanthine/CO dehydrogenase XdhC/CoxF family maturation factor